MLADIAALLEADLPFDPATAQRIFRIAGSDHASSRVLPALTRTLAACGSDIRIVWEPPGTAPLAERLGKGDLDLAVVARLKRPRDMEVLPLYEDHYVYALRAGHPRAAEPLTLDLFCAIRRCSSATARRCSTTPSMNCWPPPAASGTPSWR